MIMIMYVCVPESPTWCNKCGTAVWVVFTRNRLSAAFACFLLRLGNVCLAYPKESNCKSTHSHFSNCRLYCGKTLWKELFTAVPVEDGITLKLGCIIVPRRCIYGGSKCHSQGECCNYSDIHRTFLGLDPEGWSWGSFFLISGQKGFKSPWCSSRRLWTIMDVSMAHLWKSCPIQSHFKMIRKIWRIMATYCSCPIRMHR